MPNGTDCSCILQTEMLRVPTQWIVFDLTLDGVISSLSLEPVESLHLVPEDAACQPKAVDFLLKTYSRAHPETQGRLVLWFVVDLDSAQSRELGASLPLFLANLMFWESERAPSVVRAAYGSEDGERDFLSRVRPQYFGLSDFSGLYYGSPTPGKLYGNDFDSCFVCRQQARLCSLLERLAELHKLECASARPEERSSSGGLIIVEEAMAASQQWRKIDWFATIQYPYFPRRWDLDKDDVLRVLDYSRCPERGEDRWAALRGLERENSWDDHRLAEVELIYSDYAIAKGNHPPRLVLATFLQRRGLAQEALDQAESALNEEAGDPRWWKVQGLALHQLQNVPEAEVHLRRYRDHVMGLEPTPTTLDEAWAMHMMLNDWEEVISSARQALRLDPTYRRAYEALMIAGQETGSQRLEDDARAMAREHGVRLRPGDAERSSRESERPEVLDLVNQILTGAVRLRGRQARVCANGDGDSTVQFWIERDWHEVKVFPAQHHQGVVARFKALCELRQDWTQQEQEGQVSLEWSAGAFRFVIGTTPAESGERVDFTWYQEGVGSDLTFEELEFLRTVIQELPIEKVVNLIVVQSIRDRAKYVRLLPPLAETSTVEFFAEEQWHEVMHPPDHIHELIMARFKFLADLDLGVVNRVQQGTVSLDLDGEEYELELTFDACPRGEVLIYSLAESSEGSTGSEGFS